MAHPPLTSGVALVMLLIVGLPIGARASDTLQAVPHVRTLDARLDVLVAEGLRLSPTLRALVDRLNDSDVIVFITCERDPAARSAGRLNFMTAAGGVRYVVVRLKQGLPRPRAIAMLAHELQHAAEVADDASIVDEQSMEQAYERLGHRKWKGGSATFDTRAAVDTGYRVLEEVTTCGQFNTTDNSCRRPDSEGIATSSR
jgi:hypothetical protein